MMTPKQFKPFDDLSLDALVGGAKRDKDIISNINFIEDRNLLITTDKKKVAIVADFARDEPYNKTKLQKELEFETGIHFIDERTIAYIVSETDITTNGDMGLRADKIFQDFEAMSEYSADKSFELDNDTLMILTLYSKGITERIAYNALSEHVLEQTFKKFQETRLAMIESFGFELLSYVKEDRFNFLSALLTVSDSGKRFSQSQKQDLAEETGYLIHSEFRLDPTCAADLFSSTIYFLSGMNGHGFEDCKNALTKIASNPEMKSKFGAVDSAYLASRKGSAKIKSYFENYIRDE